MLSVTQPNDLTRAEQVAAKVARAAGRWQPLFIAGAGVLAIVMEFVMGRTGDTLFWMGLAFTVTAWTAYEHWGFSNLLDRRDAEIRQLKEATRG